MVDNLARVDQFNDNELEIAINQVPVKWCSVSLSEMVNRGKRLEASVFDVEAKQAYNLILHGKYKSVNLVGTNGPVNNAFYGGRLKRNYISKNHHDSIGFIGSSEMLDVYPHPIKFMSINNNIDDVKVKEGMLLLSRSGTIGNITYVGKTLSKLFVSEHAIRLVCDKNAGYVYAFLKTSIGKKLITSNIYGAVIQEIEPEHLASVPIPIPPEEIQKRIHDLIVHSYRLRDESNDLIDEATKLLIEELQLPSIGDFNVKYYQKNAPVETFNVKLSEMNGRADASYHVPIVNAIVEHMKKYAEEVTTIGDERISSDVVLPGRFKRVYVDKGYGIKFLGGKEINQLDPSTEKYLSKTAHKNQLEGALGIKANSILTPARGSLGDVTMPCKHFLDWAISDNMMQILSYNSIYGYIYIFLNSEYGKMLIQRFTYGGVVDAIEPEHIKQVQIPLLVNQGIQKKINYLAIEANEKRYEAYKLEQQAIKIMEEKVIYAK